LHICNILHLMFLPKMSNLSKYCSRFKIWVYYSLLLFSGSWPIQPIWLLIEADRTVQSFHVQWLVQ
jgi:hypothetical protein